MKSTANNKSEVDLFTANQGVHARAIFLHESSTTASPQKIYSHNATATSLAEAMSQKKKYIHDAFKIELWRPIHHIITSSQRLDVDGLCYHRAAHTALPRLNMQKQFRIACLQSMAGRADGALQIVDVEYSIARFEIYLLYV